MNETTRPEKIDTILDKLETHSYEMGMTLDTYIAHLETNQKKVATDDVEDWETNPPIWSHARQKQRDQHRRDRSARNRRNYQ